MRVGEQGGRRLPGGRRRCGAVVRAVAGACLLGAVSTASASKPYNVHVGDVVAGCEIPIP